ncbi:uncharacterized protein LOC126905011 [Daktulosphaira vitifoliae]|uniref:uncharacterized protein LOC126905011 n=2 Tax=Daktulosphaira vitifoliae TaxID=58002 RepID=UPI0021A9B2C6|nr:uncharacterized protein LOC126905011 [Daktulosphaira vitifoliae]
MRKYDFKAIPIINYFYRLSLVVYIFAETFDCHFKKYVQDNVFEYGLLRDVVIITANALKLHYCHHIQSAVALDVDKIRSHLYVLDAGYEECYPKIVIYDLKVYKTVQQTELLGVNGSDVSTLVVDARPLKGETRVFMGSKLGGYITVFDPGEGSWHRVALNCAEETDVPSEFLAISKFQLLIYFTSTQSNNMYSVPLRDLRNLTSYMKPSIQSDDFFGQLKARCLGEKLGTSKGLYVDIYGGINYVYARDFAAVRWIPSMGLSAEGHKVLLQSRNKLPAVTKILADSSYLQVWAINEKPDSDYQRFTVRINSLTF